jgi:hypothetical protein
MTGKKRFIPNEAPETASDLRKLIKRVVFLKSPNNIPHHDRQDMMRQLYTSISILVPYITCQEISRICARFCYRYCKDLGWRKRKIGKKVIWHKHEKSLSFIDNFQ